MLIIPHITALIRGDGYLEGPIPTRFKSDLGGFSEPSGQVNQAINLDSLLPLGGIEPRPHSWVKRSQQRSLNEQPSPIPLDTHSFGFVLEETGV